MLLFDVLQHLVVNAALVRDVGSLELGDVPPAGDAAEGLSTVVALEIDRLASFSASLIVLIDSSSAQMRSNLVLASRLSEIVSASLPTGCQPSL